MAIRIALHYRTDRDAPANVILQHAEVMTQRGERNLGPVRPGFNAGGCQSSSQLLDNNAAAQDWRETRSYQYGADGRSGRRIMLQELLHSCVMVPHA